MAEGVTTYDELRTAITDRYVALPRQLQRVAVVALERPHDLALKTVAALADDEKGHLMNRQITVLMRAARGC